MTCQKVVEQVTAHQEAALHVFAARAIDAHLAACDGCSAYYFQLERTSQLLGLLAPERAIASETLERLLMEFGRWSTIRSIRR